MIMTPGMQQIFFITMMLSSSIHVVFFSKKSIGLFFDKIDTNCQYILGAGFIMISNSLPLRILNTSPYISGLIYYCGTSFISAYQP